MEGLKVLFIVLGIVSIGIGFIIAKKVKAPILLVTYDLFLAAFGVACAVEINKSMGTLYWANFVSQSIAVMYSVVGGALISIGYAEVRNGKKNGQC